MITTIMLTGVVVSLLFALAAHLAERGLYALGRPTRVPWIVTTVATVALPAGQLLAMAFESQVSAHGAAAAQALPLTTILTVGVVERVSATTATGLGLWLLGLWVCASFVISIRLVLCSRALGRVARSWTATEVAGARAWVSETYGPAVIGLRHPEIVVPRRIVDLPLEEQRLAVTHEMEHIAARDQWLVRISALAVAIVPWNPLVWFAARRLRSAIEVDCDARVLRKKPNVRAYASLVLNVASWPRESPAGALALGEGASAQLERRLRLMTTNPLPQKLAPAFLALAGALALGVYGCEVAVSVERPEARGLSSENVVHKLPTVVTTAVRTPASGGPYFEFQVERPVTVVPGSPAPRYPQVLRLAGVEGELLVEFVVDVDGRADPATFKVLKTSHDLFSQSVQSALPQMRFAPAELRGKRVKQVVQQPFAFTIAK